MEDASNPRERVGGSISTDCIVDSLSRADYSITLSSSNGVAVRKGRGGVGIGQAPRREPSSARGPIPYSTSPKL